MRTETRGANDALDKLASLYVVIHIYEVAACLIGWSDAIRKITFPRPRREQADLDRDIQSIIARIGASAYQAAYKSGRDMTVDSEGMLDKAITINGI